MYPLHEFLFSILKQIPQDGTFDQLSPVSKLQDKYSKNPHKRTYASIDLSSATDRLPISLQVSVLKILLEGKVPDSAAFSKAWSELLVNRHYQVKMNPHLVKQCFIPKEYFIDTAVAKGVTYSVGQPMGALSSWAMLAITHHAILQYAFCKAYPNALG